MFGVYAFFAPGLPSMLFQGEATIMLRFHMA